MLSFRFLKKNARWLGAGFLLAFSSSFGQTFFISLFGAELRAEFDLSHGEYGGLYTIGTLASAASLVWLGKTADHMRLNLLAALVLASLAAVAVLMATVTSAVVLVVAIYGLRMFGQGMCSHLTFTAMGRWFDAERGRAVAIAALGFPAGEALFPITGVTLMALVGWRQTWGLVAGFLCLMSLPLAYRLLSVERVPAAKGDDGQGMPMAAHQWTRREVLRDPLFYALLPGLMAPPFILTGIIFHQAHLMETRGWDLALIAASFPIYSAGSVATSLATGWAIDRFGAGRLLPPYLLPMAAALLFLSYGTEPWVVPAFMAVTAVTGGAMSTILGALWAELYGTRHLGAIRSVTVAVMVFSTGIAPGLMGWGLDTGVAIETQLRIASAYSFACAAVFLALLTQTPRLIRAQPAYSA